MASYDIEHSVPPFTSNTVPSSSSPSSHPPPRRPDFSTFFSHLSNTTTTSTQNPHAHPMPTDISALYRLLAEGYTAARQEQQQQSRSTTTTTTSNNNNDDDDNENSPLNEMIALLLSEAEHPPLANAAAPHGASQEFIDGLERVPNRQLKKGMECPICGHAFVEDEFPLVVRLPCDAAGRHVFDLECIAPWLRVHATCPLDRKELLGGGRKEEVELSKGTGEGEEEEDGEWDDMYA